MLYLHVFYTLHCDKFNKLKLKPVLISQFSEQTLQSTFALYLESL